MQAYIAVSYSKRKSLDAELEAISSTLYQSGIMSFVFVDTYTFDIQQEQEMMAQAFADIDKCDLMIAETSGKAIGVGIEVGYAKAKGKPIVYTRQEMAEHSTTVSGASDFQVIYANVNDLKEQLRKVVEIILANSYW